MKPAKAISFNDPMVRAILDGRKTVTRRPMTPQPAWNPRPPGARWVADGYWRYGSPNPHRGDQWSTLWDEDARRRACTAEAYGWGAGAGNPSGVPGDRLWVREKARVIETGLWATTAQGGMRVRLRYEADGVESDWLPYPVRLKPVKVGHCIPNGCYREAARTFLEVTAVRAERLQDITEADAIAEGLVEWSDPPRMPRKHYGLTHADVWETDPRAAFRRVWESIYGPDAWDRNDWVWVTEFEVTP